MLGLLSVLAVLSVSLAADSVYDFSVKDIDGRDTSLEKYRGNVVLMVNVASRCGFTWTNYKEMNELYNEFAPRGLRIAAFPCKQFHQELPTDAAVKQFASDRWGVEYDLYSTIDVNGATAHPLYRFLEGETGNRNIEWNFVKFLVDRNGQPVSRFAPWRSPLSLRNEIEALLA